ncbi:MAG: CDP-glycerol glycerophosphotransferase family protein [Actinomycetales bacterium]|nr:CDP-glycerol glycerophosphotransferase family protein [Actinomycetales bacterium]
MARRTFAAGNLGKLLQLPLYALGAAATLAIPRSRQLWVAGSGIGPGEGALPLARAALEHYGRGLRVVWLAGSAAEADTARELGLETALKRSPRGFWLTARARVALVTHGLGDVNRFGQRGAFVVQLWHGIPLKRLHLDSPETLRLPLVPDHPLVRSLLRRAYRAAGRRIALFPVASEPVRARIASAFAIPAERIVVTGDPRDDVLLAGTAETRRAAARELVAAAIGPLPETGRVLLWAPTWRDGRDDPAVPDSAGWDAIADWLDAHDSTLLVRAHPLGHGGYAAGAERSPRIRLLPSSALRELTPALPAADALVTDYSSTAYDAALAGVPSVFLAPDAHDYGVRRGLYEPYAAFSDDRRHVDWAGALDELAALAVPGSAEAKRARRHVRRLREELVDPRDPGATARVLAAVATRLGPRAPRGVPPLAPPRVETPRARLLAARLLDGGAGLELELDVSALEAPPALVRLDGARATAEAALEGGGGVLRARLPLRAARWGRAELPLPSGAYRVVLDGGAESPAEGFLATDRIDPADPSRARPLRERLAHVEGPEARVSVALEAGGITVRLAAPLAPDERGPRAQRRLERAYRAARPRPERAVFFESFYGRSASDNPAGVDRALAAELPGVTRYWGVADRSIPVPEGAIPVVEGSREWWRVRAAARAIVINDWMRKRYRRRAHQRVLQTWHGTMLKRLALDRLARGPRGWRTRVAILRERARWDALLAQNPYSARIFRSAYAVRGPIWETGYPRDDALARADPAARAAARAVLGLAEGARAVLFAPTWRDDRREIVDHLDLARFAARLPEGDVLLVRGHSRTIGHGRDLDGPRLRDVTTHPEMTELLLAADVLVTDYSSVMFDWMTTDRPLVLFTPDLEHYSERLRGFYFDVVAEAPAPLARTAEELLEVLADPRAAEFAPARAAWRERFTPHDDGHAGERVLARMRAEGWID